jgi:uncharacterized protein
MVSHATGRRSSPNLTPAMHRSHSPALFRLGVDGPEGNVTERRSNTNAHVSSILLGVRDMDRAKQFYTQGLGWTVERDDQVSVVVASGGGSPVGFSGRDGPAAMVGVSPEGSGFSGFVLTYVVRSEARVDEVLADAEKAGATILKPAAALEWGGYGGAFADLDGYIWSVGYSAQGTNQPYAE